jgi:hypothetical protein
LGAGKGFDATAEESPLMVLLRIGEEIAGEWICPDSHEASQKAGAQRDAIVEHATTTNAHEKCKDSETASENP